MTEDGPPLTFVAVWGVFALLMLLGQAHLINNDAKIAMSFQPADTTEAYTMAALD